MKRIISLTVGLIFLLGMVAPSGWANDLIDKEVLKGMIKSFYSSRFWNAPTEVKLDAPEEPAPEEEATDTDATDTDATDMDATDTDEEATETEEEATETEEASEESTGIVPVSYNPDEGTITYVDPETGEEVTKTLEELGISAEWLEALLGLGGDLAWDLENNVLVGYGEDEAKKWEYDPSSHLVAHYEGPKGSERVTVVTSEEEASPYIWASPHTEDPGTGPDGHLVVQRFIYDEAGNLTQTQYFTWTAGDRQGQDKSRYMYREDTIEGDKVTPKYYNDPFPQDWDPVITGTVVKDEYGRYWLKDDKGNMYLLTVRVDGFDADGDGQSGAAEANTIDWEALVGKTITVRGHQIMSDSEGGVYYDGKKAEVFAVVDIITEFEKEEMGEEAYQELVAQMEAVAAAVDPIHEGLVSETPGQTGSLGVVNLFNGTIPEPGELTDEEHVPRLYQGIAPFYVDGVGMDILTQFNDAGLIDPALWQAIQDVQTPPDGTEPPVTDPEALYGQIWEAFNSQDFEEAQRLSEQYLQNFAGPAQEEQDPRGLYGQVGTIYWILGQIAEQQGDVNTAAAYYDLVGQRYANAQAYDPANDPDQDPTTGDEGWWNVSDAAAESRAGLEGVDENEVSLILEDLLAQLDGWINSSEEEATEEATETTEEAEEQIEEQIEEELLRLR